MVRVAAAQTLDAGLEAQGTHRQQVLPFLCAHTTRKHDQQADGALTD